jgi:hypothetical protein
MTSEPVQPTSTEAGGSAPNRPAEGLKKLVPSPLSWAYLALAAAGAVLPWMANLAFMRESGNSFDLGLFVGMANANAAAQSLSRDLAIGATATTIWMVSEARRLRMRGLLWVLLSCVTVAFAFGAPLFLYLRERRLREMQGEKPEA